MGRLEKSNEITFLKKKKKAAQPNPNEIFGPAVWLKMTYCHQHREGSPVEVFGFIRERCFWQGHLHLIQRQQQEVLPGAQKNLTRKQENRGYKVWEMRIDKQGWSQELGAVLRQGRESLEILFWQIAEQSRIQLMHRTLWEDLFCHPAMWLGAWLCST